MKVVRYPLLIYLYNILTIYFLLKSKKTHYKKKKPPSVVHKGMCIRLYNAHGLGPFSSFVGGI